MIKKTIQCLFGGLLSLAVALPVAMPVVAKAQGMSDMASDGMRKKRYRYRKRTHRVQVGLDFIPWSQDRDNKNLYLDLDLLYGYNGGYFEVGPNLSVMHPANSKFDAREVEFGIGIWGEGNFIKNTRKKKLIPALGLKANYLRMKAENNLLLSPYLSIKLFPASRTGLVLNINYDIQTSFRDLFKRLTMGLGFGLNYVHYFHF